MIEGIFETLMDCSIGSAVVPRRDPKQDIRRHFNPDAHQGKEDIAINVFDCICTSETSFHRTSDFRLNLTGCGREEFHHYTIV